jgi:hypothetical protein
MKLQPFLLALTLANAAMLIVTLAEPRVGRADAGDGVLRGRALQIVDAQGKVRASISVLPENRTDRYPDGRVGSPETVLLRLIDQHGKPNVKIGASEDGGGLGLGGGRDPAYARIAPEGAGMALTLIDRQGRQRMVTAP